MYRCQCCGRVVPPRTPCARLVAEARPAAYPRREKAHREFSRDRWRHVGRKLHDPGGVGWEIAREVRACPECAAAARGASALLAAHPPP
jgi:hypothetical protein